MAQPTNTQFALAVHVLTLLAAGSAARVSSEFLAASAGSNPVHVRRLLGRLREAGLVGSRPGPSGGWVLLADPASVTLADVWDVVNGDDAVLGVHSASPDCADGQRIQRQLVEIDRRAAAAIREELASTTVADLTTAQPLVAR